MQTGRGEAVYEMQDDVGNPMGVYVTLLNARLLVAHGKRHGLVPGFVRVPALNVDDPAAVQGLMEEMQVAREFDTSLAKKVDRILRDEK